METFEKSLFGSLALDRNFLSREQLDEAIRAQVAATSQGVRAPRLGEILMAKGYLTNEQLRSLLDGKAGRGGTLFGEIAEAWGLCSGEQVDSAIAQQIEYRIQHRRPPRLGELLLARGVLKAHQVHGILKAQGKQVVQCPGCATCYNALHVKEGLGIVCPRCNTEFTPVPPPTATVVDGEPVSEVRSDATAFLSAVETEESQRQASQRTIAFPTLSLTQYKLESRLGADASGFLYKAQDVSLNRTVTLRVIPEDAKNGAGLEAWRQAAQAASSLSHPNLQRVLLTHHDHGRLIVVSEFHEGQSLRQALHRGGRLTAVQALDVLIQCADALAYGLTQQIVHGDLRPSRVILDSAKRVHLSGLGMPKRVHANLRLLTGSNGAAPLYSAPEVLRDAHEISERSDVYGLCALGYHMVTGRAPQIASLSSKGQFRSAPPSLLAPDAINPVIPPYLSRLLLKGLARNPADRYASVRELAEDLKTCRNAVTDKVPDVPAIAPFFNRSGGLRTPLSRVAATGRAHRHRTAWRAQGGARLTLSDPPATQLLPPVLDDACESKRAAGVCPATKKADTRWTAFHTVAVASLAAVVAVSAIYFSRSARDNRAGTKAEPQNNAEQLDQADEQNGPRLLQKEFSDRVLAYQRDHPQDYNGIRYRADLFVQLYGAKYPDTEPVKEAATIRLVQSRIAAAKTRDALGERIQELILKDRFKDAQFEVVRWASYWGPDAAGNDEKFLLDRIRTAQQSRATAWLAQGRAKRAEGSWDSARALFRKAEEQFGAEYAEQACVEESITDEAEQQAKASRDEAALQKEKERVAAQRDAAAPVLLRKLVNDIQDPLAKLQFPLALKTAADAEPAFKGTGQHAAYKSIRTALQRIEGLLDRTVQACKEGRLRDFTLRVKDWDGQIVDATREGPVVKNATVQAAVAWSSLELPVLISIFERCTNNTNADEVLDLALFQIYRGELKAGQDLLNSAQQLGAQVEPHRELLQVVRWVVDAPGPKVSAADHDRELNEEAGTRSALKGMDWEISRGRWVVNPDFSLEGTPEPGTTLMSLHRQVPKFDRIEVEVRGQGDSVGFSLGKGRRFMARPIYLWQKLSLHMVGGNKLELRVDGETRASLEAVQTTQDPISPDLYLRGLGSRIEFRNFAIDGNIVRPNIAPAAKTPAAKATEGAPIPKVPEVTGMKDL